MHNKKSELPIFSTFWFSNVLRTIKYIHISKKINLEKKNLVKEIKDQPTKHITDYYYTPKSSPTVYISEQIFPQRVCK